jgi:hypothetical protein
MRNINFLDVQNVSIQISLIFEIRTLQLEKNDAIMALSRAVYEVSLAKSLSEGFSKKGQK